jgi:hypothetical protein
MQRVSSQLTIFLRIVVPTMWFTSIISLLFLLSWAVTGISGVLSHPLMWTGLLLIAVCGFALIRWILWRLYRVDMDDHAVYVSNYFKTYKYPVADIESIASSKILPGRIFIIHLISKGSFGQHIYFLASQALWKDYLLQHPQVREKLKGE